MTYLLGLKDKQITSKHETSWQTNKIGGTGDWHGAGIDPVCPACGRPLLLVVQLYCPQQGSAYHRTLHIFACCRRQCWNTDHSWQVFRCQSLDKPVAGDQEPDTAADDWGVEADEWGSGADDWGTDDGDWGTETTAPAADILGACIMGAGSGRDWSQLQSGKPHLNPPKMLRQLISIDSNAQASSDSASDHGNSAPDILTEIPVHQLSVRDPDRDVEEMAEVVAEDLPVVPVELRQQMLTSLQDNTHPAEHGGKQLLSYYLNVIEEPTNQDVMDSHVTRLLDEYERNEGYSVTELDEHITGSGGAGEKYERTSVVHRDLIFHKFMKRTSICPQQCVRYCWEGQPLYLSQPPRPEDLPSACRHCGGDVVFELQLMPSLVNSLKFDDDSGVAVEFGAVFVISCKASCWEDGDHYRAERIVLQPDPDQHLFQ